GRATSRNRDQPTPTPTPTPRRSPTDASPAGRDAAVPSRSSPEAVDDGPAVDGVPPGVGPRPYSSGHGSCRALALPGGRLHAVPAAVPVPRGRPPARGAE